jgi:multiple sugar transport system substrate-binding protein
MFSQDSSKHRLSRRSFLRLTAGASLATALASACVPASPSPAADSGAGAAQPAGEPVSVRYTTVGWGGWLSEPWIEMVDQFNESQSAVQVAYEDIAEGYEKVMAQAAGNVGADVYNVTTKEMYSLAARGFFLPLDDMVASSQTVKEENYYAEDWVEVFFKGKQYLAPHSNSPAMIWYNTDLFDEVGVAYPPAQYDDPNWTQDIFLETALKLTKGEGADKVYGWVGERWWVYLLNWIWSNGGWLLNEEKTACMIDMPETVEALEWAAALVHEHKVQPAVAEIIQGGNSAMFFGHRAAMAQKGTWWAIDLKAQEGLNWNVAPHPMGKAGTFVRNPLDAVGIWQGSKAPQESWQFIEFLSQPEIMGIIVLAGLSVSHKEAMAEYFLAQEPQHVHWDLFVQALDGHTRQHPDTAIFPEMDDLLITNWEAVLDGTSTVQEMVAAVKDPINTLLADCIAAGNCAG